MPRFESEPPYRHGDGDALGVLLVNLGTPDDPSPAAVRRYLAEFLWDPRVVELPRPLWWLVLHGLILRTRPGQSAKAYQKIWTEAGSPLLRISADIVDAVQLRLGSRLAGPVHVRLGMSYGKPSIASALDALHAEGVRRMVVLPMYPQYSGTTTGSVFDAVTRTLAHRRWVPEFRFISSYHDAPGYVAALAASVREYWERHGRGDKLLLSFHGVPKQTLLDGDPYHCQCQKTARLLAGALELEQDDWCISFQSRVGRAEWLRPYTDETIAEFGNHKLGRLDVVCPGFSADCLETLEEIAIQNAELFEASGGGELRYIPALNVRDDHVDFLARLIVRHAFGWPESSDDYSAGDLARQRDKSRERALAMGAER